MATASPSSAPERRGQASPTAALVAVAAVGIGLSLYATVFAGVAPTADRNVAEPTMSRVDDAVAPAGVAEPERLDGATDVGPAGWSLAVELRTESTEWTVGEMPAARAATAEPAPTAASDVQSAERRVPVRLAPGDVRAGWLRVVVRR